jgi:hypothetical protein
VSQGKAQKHFYKLCEDRKYVNDVRFHTFQGFFSVVGWLFLEGQVWVGSNACYPLSAFGSFILTFQGCLGLSGGMFRVLY